MIEITEKDRKLLESFPKYEGKGPFVGTRDYWEGIFDGETNRDPKLHEAFGKLHEHIVEEVLQFCKEHNLTNAFAFYVGADGITHDIKDCKWSCFTDSYMSLYNGTRMEDHPNIIIREEDPFLHEI